jgi:hypothetical protein
MGGKTNIDPAVAELLRQKEAGRRQGAALSYGEKIALAAALRRHADAMKQVRESGLMAKRPSRHER